MRIPILVVCLAVLYGTCIYAEENINLKEGIENEWDYKSNYFNAPLERFLSRRSYLQSPFAVNDLSKFPNFRNKTLNKQLDLCTNCKHGNSSGNLTVIRRTITEMKCLVCHIGKFIVNEGLGILRKILSRLSKFIRKILLPDLDTLLNKFADTFPLPSQIVTIINLLNLLYTVLQLLGYI